MLSTLLILPLLFCLYLIPRCGIIKTDNVKIVVFHCYDSNPDNKQLQGGFTLARSLRGYSLLWQGRVGQTLHSAMEVEAQGLSQL